MSTLRLVFLVGSLSIVTGCYGSHATPPAAPAFDGSGSWTRVASSQGPFIYAAAGGAVNIFTYLGQRVGSLTGFQEATGICSDGSGNIYVVDYGRDLIYKFLSGGTLPVYVYDDRYLKPSGCAVDPITGNLAVTNLGNVVIYPAGAYQSPLTYTAPNIASYNFCAYDPAGNLYVDGMGNSEEFELAALPSGSSQFVAVPLSGINNHHHKPAGVQWDGQYLAVGDRLSDAIYRITVSGSSGTIVQTVPIRGWYRHETVSFDVVGKRVLFPFDYKLLFYKYPIGGRKTTGFLGTVGEAITVTNSQ